MVVSQFIKVSIVVVWQMVWHRAVASHIRQVGLYTHWEPGLCAVHRGDYILDCHIKVSKVIDSNRDSFNPQGYKYA